MADPVYGPQNWTRPGPAPSYGTSQGTTPQDVKTWADTIFGVATSGKSTFDTITGKVKPIAPFKPQSKTNWTLIAAGVVGVGLLVYLLKKRK